MTHPETLKSSETTAELEKAAAERSVEVAANKEHSHESSPESKAERVESARVETEAAFSKEAGKERANGGEPTAAVIRRVTKSEREASYQATMKHINKEMGVTSRTFSKVIHTPVVEKSSEILGSSLARPNAILAGSTSALILVAITYGIARIFGYQLSGFETIGAFILGWIVGIIYDYAKIMTGGRRK